MGRIMSEVQTRAVEDERVARWMVGLEALLLDTVTTAVHAAAASETPEGRQNYNREPSQGVER